MSYSSPKDKRFHLRLFSISNILLSSMHDIQICELSDDALKDITSYHSFDKIEEKGGKRDGHKEEEQENEAKCAKELMTITSVIDIGDSFKRTTNNVGLNEDNKRTHRSKKI